MPQRVPRPGATTVLLLIVSLAALGAIWLLVQPPTLTPGRAAAAAETQTRAPAVHQTRPPSFSAADEPLSATCDTSLQSLVDAASAGSTVEVPACIFRETVTIDKPLTLDGQGAAQIRGSDVWTSWSQNGSVWVSSQSVPSFPVKQGQGRCLEHTNMRCAEPEQVFLNGQPLQRVEANPKSGQFALDDQRHVLLGDNPDAQLVEVTVRTSWIETKSDGVTIRGFTMKHAANDAEFGGVGNQGYSGWTLEDNTLSDAHGAVVGIGGGIGLRVVGNDISRGGQLGIEGSESADVIVQSNRVHDNNTDEFNWKWEAGGMKLVHESNLLVDGNEVWGNQGPGIWCDIGCQSTTISWNRVYQNLAAGIFYEISSGGAIEHNAIWGTTASGDPAGGYGAGILLASSGDVQAVDNVVAWNVHGIVVRAEDRPDRIAVSDTHIAVRGNVVAVGPQDTYALAWLPPGGEAKSPLFDPSSGNSAAANGFWFASPGQAATFGWGGRNFSQVGDFQQTPGGAGSRSMTPAERDSALQAECVPLNPGDKPSACPQLGWP